MPKLIWVALPLLATLLLALLAAWSVRPKKVQGAPSAEVVPQVVPPEALNPDVRQDTIQPTICQPGYTASVSPSTTVTIGVKVRLLRERGLPASASKDYEPDHL